MHKKGSMWMLLSVALVALGLLALVGLDSSSAGEVTGPRVPRAGPKPPLVRPVVVDRVPDTIVYESSEAAEATADEMAELQRSVCYLINLQLDSDSGKNTPPERISSVCPAWV